MTEYCLGDITTTVSTVMTQLGSYDHNKWQTETRW